MKRTRICIFAFCLVGWVDVSSADQREVVSQPPEVTVTAGKIAVANTSSTPGIPKQVTLTKVAWEASFGTSTVRITIPGTGYAIPLVGGKVMPVIIREHPLGVWKIDGLRFRVSDHDSKRKAVDELITNANRIEPGDRTLKLILTGGEVYEVWTLDFTDRKKGLQIRYQDGGGW